MRSSIFPKKIIVVLSTCFFVACSPYKAKLHDKPGVEIPDKFSSKELKESIQKYPDEYLWWSSFKDQNLNTLLELAFANNFSLEASWQRMLQANELASQASSGLSPSVNIDGSAQRNRTENRVSFRTDGVNPGDGASYFTNYVVQAGLSYEIDLWQRVMSTSRSAGALSDTARANVETTALMLAASVAETWFILNEQKALIDLIKKQIVTSEKLFELTELRFSLGRGTALGVFQQKEQLAAVKSELPRAEALYQTTINQLLTLIGNPAGSKLPVKVKGKFPKLSNLPRVSLQRPFIY